MTGDEIEQLKNIIIDPLATTIRSEIQPLHDEIADHQKRITKLEGMFGKVLIGFTVFSTGLGLVWGVLWAWLKKKLGL